jgi:hypothetical protein
MGTATQPPKVTSNILPASGWLRPEFVKRETIRRDRRERLGAVLRRAPRHPAGPWVSSLPESAEPPIERGSEVQPLHRSGPI